MSIKENTLYFITIGDFLNKLMIFKYIFLGIFMEDI